jgi:putative DNA primase/helicase
MTIPYIYSPDTQSRQDPTEIDWCERRDEQDCLDQEDIEKLGRRETTTEKCIRLWSEIDKEHEDGVRSLEQDYGTRATRRDEVVSPETATPETTPPPPPPRKTMMDDDNYEELEPDPDPDQAFAEMKAFFKEPKPLLSPGDPCHSAQEFVKRTTTRLVYWRGDFYQWEATHYEKADDQDIRRTIYRFLNDAMTEKGAFKANKKKVDEVIDALKAEVLLSARVEPDSGLDIITFKNGLLLLADNRLVEHNPARFSLGCLPYPYDPSLPEPTNWLAFLKSLWPDRSDNIELLQEIFGYYISGRTDLQKIFLLLGPPRSGKGTIREMLTNLLGKNRVVGIMGDRFGKDFGMSGLIDKTALIIPDMRENKRGNDLSTLTERLLNISGEDPITIARKYKDDWQGKLNTRIMIMSNEEPRLPDATGTIATRFIPLKMTISFLGREDRTLRDNLTPETAQVMNWALAGLRRLNERGYFVIPEDSEEIIQHVREAANPLQEFVDDFLIQDPSATTFKSRVFDAYKGWCMTENYKGMNSNHFARELRSLIPGLKDERPRVNGQPGPRMWGGIRLRDPGQVLSPFDDSGTSDMWMPEHMRESIH